MNAAHVHLIFAHIPIVGLGFAILLNLFAIFRKNNELLKFAGLLYILLALVCVVNILTGDGTGEILKSYPGVTEESIENHETFGYIVFYGLIALGVLSIYTLWFGMKKEELLKKVRVIMIIVALVTAGFAIQTGLTGGSIRHTEVEQGAYQPK